jgi:hypothetical protein
MQMRTVGSFGSFRRAVHMIGCAGTDCSSVVRRPLGRLRLARLTRRALQIQTMKGEARLSALTSGHSRHSHVASAEHLLRVV